MNLNKVFIIGRLTADPVIRTTPSGQSVSSFSVATNRVWTDKAGQKKEETEFHNVVVWGRQAEVAGQFLTKGSMVMIEGRLQTRTWQDKEGQNRKTTEIISERLQLGPRPTGATSGSFSQNRKPSFENNDDIKPKEEIPTIEIEADGIKDEDLPF
ncbi:MAG: single-stranded DNA-binding protein [Candidatus Pacebacteria bacterium]|nr:single-stranded DNA-binding protein [Candidatus Paceibacterota bacterium]